MDCGRSTDRPGRAGTTLTELMVVLVVLGVMATFVSVAWYSAQPRAADAGPAGVIAAARRQAIESGAAVQTTVTLGDSAVHVLALPDGRLVGTDGRDVDPLSGHWTSR
jgi:prepilin-type N-terminal cleavage/methylation domain-containing protein